MKRCALVGTELLLSVEYLLEIVILCCEGPVGSLARLNSWNAHGNTQYVPTFERVLQELVCACIVEEAVGRDRGF